MESLSPGNVYYGKNNDETPYVGDERKFLIIYGMLDYLLSINCEY